MTTQPSKNPGLAREVYFGMGYGRSLAKLAKLLKEMHGVAPTVRTLEQWCRRDQWVAGAKVYDPCLSGLHPHPLGLEWARDRI